MNNKLSKNLGQMIDHARQVLEIEAKSLMEISGNLDESFTRACEMLLACKGRIVVSGIGKSGHIGRKISSTLSSTGSPSFFVHPAEASHGDLGMVTNEDIVIAISYLVMYLVRLCSSDRPSWRDVLTANAAYPC